MPTPPISGILAPHMVPLDDRGEIAEPELRRHVSWLIDRGIKDSSGDVSHMLRLIAAVRLVRPDFSFLTGWDPALVPMLAAGCDGGTNAASTVMPELTRALFDAAREGRLAAALRMQHRLTELFDALFGGVDFPEGFRAGGELRGFRMGVSRQPLADEQRAERVRLADRVRSLLEKLGVDMGQPDRAAELPLEARSG